MSVDIVVGDCRQQLRVMPDASVHCCVTSPPYFGLRDYGVDEQIGLEPTPDAFVAEMVGVFREVRRVLRDDGTLWLNLGDSYSNSGGAGWQGKNGQRADRRFTAPNFRRGIEQGKAKDLIGVPWRVAFALQADGWYLRQDIIWHKPNPMPESVRDRCTKAHEYVFLMAKSERYFYDADAIAEPAANPEGPGNVRQKYAAAYEAGDARHRTAAGLTNIGPREKRNRRSVWSVTSEPFAGAHFATFPPSLIEPMILAGCPIGGTVLDPFGGAGTTGLVADRLGRNAILIELNPAYACMARERIAGDAPLFVELATPPAVASMTDEMDVSP